MTKVNYGIRHGEALLMPIEKMPKGTCERVNKYIVAHSESGHHHVLESKEEFEVISDKEAEELFIRLYAPAQLVHEKTVDAHKTLTVPQGIWKVMYKREYDPFSKVIRRIYD